MERIDSLAVIDIFSSKITFLYDPCVFSFRIFNKLDNIYMEISIIFDIFTVFLLALLRLGRILPGFFATVLPHMVGKPRPSMTDATVKEIL